MYLYAAMNNVILVKSKCTLKSEFNSKCDLHFVLNKLNPE